MTAVEAPASKLRKLAAIQDFDAVEDLLLESKLGFNCSGICLSAECNYTSGLQHSAELGYCPKCKANTVKSALSLAYRVEDARA